MSSKHEYQDTFEPYDHEYTEPLPEDDDGYLEIKTNENQDSLYVSTQIFSRQEARYNPWLRVFALVCVIIVLNCITSTVTYILVKKFNGKCFDYVIYNRFI